jgi:CRISPR/Cas system CSM-associated protein Csm5 (group 7 of RAMP superfamily)
MLKELRDADATSFRRRVVDKIRAVLDDRRKKPQQKKKEVGEFLTRDFFQHCTSRTDEPHTDLLRALKVGDSRPLDPDTLDFDLVRMISLDKGDGDGWHFSFRKKRGEVLKDRTTGKPLPIDIFTEVLTPGPGTAEIEGTISIDQTILADLETSPRTTAVPSWFWTIESIIDTCQDFTRHCIQEEEKRFYNRLKGVERIEAFYRETEPNLRIGWGSGLIETTIISLLPDAVRDRVRELFWDRWMQQAFQGQSKDFPKTRRAIVYNDEPVVPLGWVRLEAGQ